MSGSLSQGLSKIKQLFIPILFHETLWFLQTTFAVYFALPGILGVIQDDFITGNRCLRAAGAQPQRNSPRTARLPAAGSTGTGIGGG